MKYKVIKGYPGSPKVGTIFTENDCHGIMQSEIEEYIGFFEPILEPKFKVGDWVIVDKSKCNESVYCDIFKITGFFSGKKRQFGNVEHRTLYEGNGIYTSRLRLATEEEIKNHLIEEARKRGFVAGVKFKCANSGKICTLSYHVSDYYGSKYNSDHLTSSGGSIYLEGKWAEIVKDEEIEIKGYPAVFVDHEFSPSVSFGCKIITLDELWGLRKVYLLDEKMNGEFPILVNNGVTLKMIDKMINRLEKK